MLDKVQCLGHSGRDHSSGCTTTISRATVTAPDVDAASEGLQLLTQTYTKIVPHSIPTSSAGKLFNTGKRHGISPSSGVAPFPPRPRPSSVPVAASPLFPPGLVPRPSQFRRPSSVRGRGSVDGIANGEDREQGRHHLHTRRERTQTQRLVRLRAWALACALATTDLHLKRAGAAADAAPRQRFRPWVEGKAVRIAQGGRTGLVGIPAIACVTQNERHSSTASTSTARTGCTGPGRRPLASET